MEAELRLSPCSALTCPMIFLVEEGGACPLGLLVIPGRRGSKPTTQHTAGLGGEGAMPDQSGRRPPPHLQLTERQAAAINLFVLPE